MPPTYQYRKTCEKCHTMQRNKETHQSALYLETATITASIATSSIQSQNLPTATDYLARIAVFNHFFSDASKPAIGVQHLSFTFSFSMLICSPAAISLHSIHHHHHTSETTPPRHHATTRENEHYRQREFLTWLTINVPPVSQTDRQCRKRWVLICNLSTNYLWHMPAAVDTSVLSIDTCTVQRLAVIQIFALSYPSQPTAEEQTNRPTDQQQP